MNIPELPIQVVAVTDSAATTFHQTQELNQVLVAEVSPSSPQGSAPHPLLPGKQPCGPAQRPLYDI